MRAFLEWLGNTPWSVRLLESFYVWPLLESAHVLGISLFVGTAAMMDLRLIGVGFRSVPVSEFTARMLPWTRASFVAMMSTGLLIFYSNPVRYYHNIFFRVKILLLVLAGLNAWWFHFRTHPRVSDWDRDPVPPLPARLAGGISLFAWAFIVVSGRMIAYNWFDCDIQPQTEFVNWAAGCVLPGE